MIKIAITRDESEKTKKEMADAVDVVLEACGLQCENYAMLNLENNPRRVDTGLLRNSITHALSGEQPVKSKYSGDKARNGKVPTGSYAGTADSDPPGKKAVYIGTNVEYALHVHDGTSKMTPNRFMKNALEAHKSEYIKMIETFLKK